MQTSNTVETQQEETTSPETEGFYAADVDFRSGIVANQSPLLMCIVAAIGGFVPPEQNKEFVYCDLGCGDGTTLNGLAEIYPDSNFIGIDLSERHVYTAQRVAEENNLGNVRFIQSSFSQLDLNELPEFDFVAMNGIYAWLENKEIRAVQDFLQEKLKPGGLFYVQYTSLPGKISVQPLWSLIQHLVPDQEGQDSRERAKKGLDLTEALAKRGMSYLTAHRPAANGAQSYVRGRKRDPYREDHFAHNAMASGFRPRYFTEMYDEMSTAGLSYAGRCELRLNEIETSVNPPQVPTFQDYKSDVRTVELLKDYIRNEQVRNDIFVKQATPDQEKANAWLDQNLYLLSRMPAANVQRFITTMGNNRIPLRGPAYEAVINAADQGSVTPREVADNNNLPIERVRKASIRLLASNQFFHCRTSFDVTVPDPTEIGGINIVGEMNRRTLNLSCERLTQNQLISAYTGGPAITISAIEAVVLKAVIDNCGFDGAVQKAAEFLQEETRPLPTTKGPKKGKDISTEELEEVLQAMRGRKMLNMLRLGIVEAMEETDTPQQKMERTEDVEQPAPEKDSSALSETVSLEGCSIHIKSAGSGDKIPVLLLHGAKFSAATWDELGTLTELANTGYPAKAMDLPGFGESEKCSVQPAQVVSSYLNSFSRPPVLVGPSMSGQLALELAISNPEKLGGLVLIAPTKVPQLAQKLRGVNLPSLILWGDQDSVVSVDYARILEKNLSGAVLRIFQGGGHTCYLDHPRKWLSDLLEFLSGLD